LVRDRIAHKDIYHWLVRDLLGLVLLVSVSIPIEKHQLLQEKRLTYAMWPLTINPIAAHPNIIFSAFLLSRRGGKARDDKDDT
jgi:hypothetical protein